MENFKPDKKLKRKRIWKKWRRTRNILENWLKEEENRSRAGLSHRSPPVEFADRRKYYTKEQREMQRKIREKIKKARKIWEKKKPMLKLRWYKKLWLWFLYRLHKWLTKIIKK